MPKVTVFTAHPKQNAILQNAVSELGHLRESLRRGELAMQEMLAMAHPSYDSATMTLSKDPLGNFVLIASYPDEEAPAKLAMVPEEA